MRHTLLDRALLCGVAALLLASPAGATTRWFQVPARPAWVDVPGPWKVAADPSKSRLNATHERGGRLLIVAESDNAPEEVLAALKKALEVEYPGAELKLEPPGITGRVTVGDVALPVVAEARQVEGTGGALTVAVASVAPRQRADETRKVADKALASALSRWKRPGGALVSLGDTGLVIRQPQDGWEIIQAAGQLDRLRTYGGEGEVQAAVSTRPGEDPMGVIERYARGLASTGISWSAATDWRPEKVSREIAETGRQMTGTMSEGADGGAVTYRAMLRAVKLPSGAVLLLIGTAQGADGEALLSQAQEITGSLSPAD